MISVALDRVFNGLQFELLDPYEQFIDFGGFQFEKMWTILEKQPFFRADMTGLGKYHTGGNRQIGELRG